MAKRLRDVCKLPEDDKLWRIGRGFFVSFAYSHDALRQIQAFFKNTGKTIIPLTVKDILDEHIAYKLA